MNPKRGKNHKKAQEKNGIHRAVFEKGIATNSINVTDGHLPHDDCADPVTDQDERDSECECECAEHAINRKAHINRFQVENFTKIGEAGTDECFFRFFRMLTKSMNNEECCRAHNGTKRKQIILLERMPYDRRKNHRYNSIEPSAQAK